MLFYDVTLDNYFFFKPSILVSNCGDFF